MNDKLSAPLDDFKERELEILGLMADGLSNQAIADQLYITKETVRWYNKQIYSKLGTSRRTEAIALARSMGLLEDPQENNALLVARPTLPTPTGPFVGRNREMQEIIGLLNNPNMRLLSIVAAGGMGKSRLSLEVAHQIKDAYTHGAVFIDLTACYNPKDIAQFALDALRVNTSSSKNPEVLLLDYCLEKNLLLIFDNVEHLLADISIFARILEHAPSVQIITTTREKLNLRIETTYLLQPVLEQGATLFREVASLMHPHIEFMADDTPHIVQIVELVGGLPLGLTLASTWVDMLTLREIIDEIQHNLDFLASDMADMPHRQRSIHAVIDPTWKRLSDTEKRAFMQVSVFRGGFTRKLFQEITGASLQTLQILMHRSLIGHGYGQRYDMHPLLRQYAREKLNQDDTLRINTKKRHLESFMKYAQDHAVRMYRGSYLESLDMLELEADNIRAALDWSLQGNNLEQGIALILANCEFWLTRSKSLEALAYIGRAIQQANYPKLYYWQATYLDRLGRIDDAIEAAQYLIEYSETTQDYEELAYGQLRLALLKNSREEAENLVKVALSNALKTDNQKLIAECYSVWALAVSNNFDEAISEHPSLPLFQKALDIYETLGDLGGISRVTNNMAIHYHNSPEHEDEAKKLMEYSLRLKRQMGDRAGQARRLTTLSLWAMEDEDYEAAQEWLTTSRLICEELGEKDRLTYVLTTEGILYLLKMELEQARLIFGRNLEICATIRDYKLLVDIYAFLGYIHLLRNNKNDAHETIVKGLEVARSHSSFPALLIMLYASYLLDIDDQTTCIAIVATLAQTTIKSYSGSQRIIDRYFLQPLIFRIHQRIGDDAWQTALHAASNTTVEQRLQQAIHTLL